MTDTATSTHTATLLVAGTTIGSWESAAAAVLGLPRADVRQLPQWPTALAPGQRLVGFVDSPVRALGVGLPVGRDADPAPLLDAWCASAQQALRLVQRHPGQCLLLDVEELLLHPGAGQSACAAHLGVAPQSTVAPAPLAEHDAVRRALAHLTVAQHRRARLMAEELVAACAPLEPMEGTSAVVMAAPDLASAMARLVELEAAAARAPSQAARIEGLQRLQAEALRERDAARAQLAGKHRDEASALAQLHQTQAELESVLERLASLDAELLAARSQAQQAEALLQARLAVAEAAQHAAEGARLAAEQRQAQAGTRLAALQAELEARSAAAQEAAARAQHEAVEREAAAHEAQSRAALQLAESKKAAETERQLLLVQLHQVQEELERFYLENERLASTVAEPLAAAVRVDRMVPGLVRDEAPHRELNLNLRGVQLPRGDWAEIPVRLLDHHGHAGLAIFATDERRPPLSAWTSSGREGDRPFMLLVPSDANTRAAFENLSASDWRLVQAVAAHLAHHVSERRAALAPRWSATAARLQLELAALPERWRHDHAEVRSAAQAGRIAIELDNVGLPGRVTEHLSILWAPGRHGDGGGLQLALAEGAVPPLTAWPLDEEGRPSMTWDLLPAGVASSERSRLWRRIPRVDRAWLQTMLDALPGLIGNSAEHRGFVPQAQALAAFARQAAQGPRWRRVARRLLGRTDR